MYNALYACDVCMHLCEGNVIENGRRNNMHFEARGLSINLMITECITRRKKRQPSTCSIRIETFEVRQVESFFCLGTLINSADKMRY